MFSYHQNLFLVLLLLNTLLHYIQNQFIFNLENIQNIFKQKEFELDYNYVQKMLGIINNSNFKKKNKKLIYIQKRYVVSDKAKQKVIDNLYVSIGSLGLGGALGMAGVFSSIKVNESTVKTGIDNAQTNKDNLVINAKRLALEEERLAFEKRQIEIKNALEKSKVDLEKDKELHQFFKDLKEKNKKDNLMLNQKIKEHNNSYLFKKNNTSDINFFKNEIEKNEKEMDLIFSSIYKNNQQLNNFNSKTTSNNINEDNNLVPSVFENMFL